MLISEYVLINDMFLTTREYKHFMCSEFTSYIFSLLDFYPRAQASRVMYSGWCPCIYICIFLILFVCNFFFLSSELGI